MIITSFYYAIISFIFIFVVHYLYEYFKENLTIPKEKDMIEKPRETYNKIYETLQNNSAITSKTNTQMKDELKNYLKELKKTAKSADTNQVNNEINSFNMDGNSVGFSEIGTEINANSTSTSIEQFSPF